MEGPPKFAYSSVLEPAAPRPSGHHRGEASSGSLLLVSLARASKQGRAVRAGRLSDLAGILRKTPTSCSRGSAIDLQQRSDVAPSRRRNYQDHEVFEHFAVSRPNSTSVWRGGRGRASRRCQWQLRPLRKNAGAIAM